MLANHQGLLKGDLNHLQRAALVYVLTKEDESKNIEKYKELMITHPHQEKIIDYLYGRGSEDDELAPMMSEEELETAGPRSIQDIEQALDIMRDLGFAVQDL